MCERIAATGALEEARGLALTHVAAAKTELTELDLSAGASAPRPRRRRRRGALRLEVLRPAGCAPRSLERERPDEALDLFGHVGAHQALVVAGERVAATVELLVELLDVVLGEDTLAVDVAVRAVEEDVPVLGAGLVPLDRIYELGGAIDADVEVLMSLGGACSGAWASACSARGSSGSLKYTTSMVFPLGRTTRFV